MSCWIVREKRKEKKGQILISERRRPSMDEGQGRVRGRLSRAVADVEAGRGRAEQGKANKLNPT